MQGTTDVIERLRREGYRLTSGYVGYLMRDGLVSASDRGPGGVRIWTEGDVDRLRRVLQQRGRFSAGAARRELAMTT